MRDGNISGWNKAVVTYCKSEETTYVGQQFKTVDQGIVFYHAYAKAVGFDVKHNMMRKDREGEMAIKYMVCSREGFKPNNKEKNTGMGVCTEPKKRREQN
nr:protein FAR1-RELATED SEQUENCE 5-like [Ipomoea batatas]GME04971.1 protein FAR1-RELATED SEQUENCE 5-like [Ipomoea batatas]